MLVEQVAIHSPDISPVLAIGQNHLNVVTLHDEQKKLGQSINSLFINVKVSLKEFVTIDHPSRPCQGNDEMFNRCEVKCYERFITSVTECRYHLFIINVHNLLSLVYYSIECLT